MQGRVPPKAFDILRIFVSNAFDISAISALSYSSVLSAMSLTGFSKPSIII